MRNQKNWFSCGRETPIGYSPRIFLRSTWDDSFKSDAPKNICDMHDFLKKMSCWGGSDKSWGKEQGYIGEWDGYEIPVRRYDDCIAMLTEFLGEQINRKDILSNY